MKVLLFGVFASAILVGCGGGSGGGSSISAGPTLAEQARTLAGSSSTPLTGDPQGNRVIPDIEDPLAQLGMKLFFSRSLSGDKDVACVTCHHPMLGGGDDMSMPVGTEAEDPNLLGPGRTQKVSAATFDGLPTVPRNAPTIFNLAIWDQSLFLDGRIAAVFDVDGIATGEISSPDSGFDVADLAISHGSTLDAALARFPVTSDVEMRGFTFEAGNTTDDVRDHLVLRLQGATGFESELTVNNWLAEFRAAFNAPTAAAHELITYENIANAISAYQRSLWFVDNPWNQFLNGDDNAISDDAKSGAILFFTSISEGGAGCSGCHSGDRFTSERFANVAMPQVGRGTGSGASGMMDLGRFDITGDDSDRFKFRIPSLLNVAETGPWTHSGAYTDLRTLVKHYTNIEAAVTGYDVTQLDFVQNQSTVIASTQGALDTILASRLAAQADPSVSALQDAPLSDEGVDQVVAFLSALTDPCVTDRACLSAWTPDAVDSDPDALRIEPVDQQGNFLN